MTTSEYRTVRRALVELGAFRVSDTRGLLTVLAEFALFVVGFIILNHGSIPFGARYWMIELLLGTSLYRMFVILHECGHNTLFRSRAVSTLIGTFVSPFCLMPYFPWRSIHFLHHKWVGVIDKDPTQAHLLNCATFRIRGGFSSGSAGNASSRFLMSSTSSTSSGGIQCVSSARQPGGRLDRCPLGARLHGSACRPPGPPWAGSLHRPVRAHAPHLLRVIRDGQPAAARWDLSVPVQRPSGLDPSLRAGPDHSQRPNALAARRTLYATTSTSTPSTICSRPSPGIHCPWSRGSLPKRRGAPTSTSA